jgi:hypothetical protein
VNWLKPRYARYNKKNYVFADVLVAGAALMADEACEAKQSSVVHARMQP